MFWSCSISLTIFLTLCIVMKLMLMRRRIHAAMSCDFSSPYISIATVLVESAVLYSAFALVFIVTYAMGSNVNFLVIRVLGQVQVRLARSVYYSRLMLIFAYTLVHCAYAHYTSCGAGARVDSRNYDEHPQYRCPSLQSRNTT